ncbi:MAG: discoidin domain-containing protein, partial [Prevotella sp.]|nr:discoidin domain-containing protein [Prevotella sp.]
NGYNTTTKSYDAKAQLNRMCYEVVINVTEKSDKAATVNVETNNANWGTVEVWTDETPDGSTGTEWVVSANIPMYLRATKASEDVEFLGWYDHYGRLLANELEYTMYAREDATYTAKFRKALDIDGWQFEYRTEPGSEIVTNKLANGVNPEAGKTYYIYAPTRPTNNGEYVNRYLYNNSGTLTLSTTESTAASYLWICSIEDGKYIFQNVADPTKYLKHKGLANTPYGFELGTGTTYYEGLTMQSVPGDGETRNLFFVINDDGSGFNHSEKTHNQSTENYTTDFVFTEVSTPDVVILTNVRKSGNHDLVIPETVEILGEQCKIVGFDNNLFKNNKDLWTISLPSTIEEMSNNKVFTGVVKGKGANASANAANYITTDLGTTLAAGEDWSISLTIEDNGNNFNQWGSALIATGNAPMNSTYGKGFQLYMQAGGGLVVKTDADSDAHKLTNLTKGSKYRIDIVYTHANTQLKVTATPLTSVAALTAARRTKAAREASSLTVTQDMSDFSVVSHAIPEGVNITKLEVRKGTEPDPFEGCTNLLGVNIADGCEEFYVADGTLYTAGGTNLHKLADAKKEEEIRALGTLIDNTKALMDVIATSIDPVGKSTEITMQATEPSNPYYIWCSNPHPETHADGKGGVAALLDEDANTYLHTNWSSLSTTHDYLQINNVNPEDLYNFKIAGQQRADGSNDRPKFIEIYGSNDNSTWTPIATVTGLPNTGGATWSSNIIPSDVKYSYLKFIVKTHDNENNVGRPYFHMAKFDLFKLTSLVEVAPIYKNLAGITNDKASEVYDNLVKALYLYSNGGTEEELQTAYNTLNPLYTALDNKKNKVLNGVYKLQARTYMDDSGAHDFAADVFVAYNTDATDNPKSSGYKLIATGTYTASVEADKYFTITPNDNGYTLQAQGLYVKAPQNLSKWGHILCTDDVSVAGYYLLEDVDDNLYKLVNNQNGNNHLNAWQSQKFIFGNETSSKFSKIAYEKVETYTLTVPASGVTTLCL